MVDIPDLQKAPSGKPVDLNDLGDPNAFPVLDIPVDMNRIKS